MSKLTISAIIPTYNRARRVAKAVESCLAQTHPCHEIIVVDDGSYDDTVAVLQAYGAPVRVIRQPNSGPAVARTAGLNAATGQYIAFLDDDDTWLPHKLQCEVAVLQRGGAAASYSDFSYITTDGNASPQVPRRPHPTDMWTALLMGNWVSTSNVVVRSDVLREAGAFDTRFTPCEDWDMWLRIARSHPWVYVPEVLSLILWHDQSINKNVSRMVRGTWEVLDKHTGRGGALIPRRLRRKVYSAAHYRVGMYYLAGGNCPEAVREMLLGVGTAPERLLLEPGQVGQTVAALSRRAWGRLAHRPVSLS